MVIFAFLRLKQKTIYTYILFLLDDRPHLVGGGENKKNYNLLSVSNKHTELWSRLVHYNASIYK